MRVVTLVIAAVAHVQVMVVQEALRKSGYSVQPDEEQLRSALNRTLTPPVVSPKVSPKPYPYSPSS